MFFSKSFPLLSVALCGFTAAAPQPALPIVDLGYELHQAASFNQAGGFFNFSNIRFAAPPVGELRFAASVPPAVNRAHVQTGNVGVMCPQAAPDWTVPQDEFIAARLAGLPFNENAALASISPPHVLGKQDPRTTEDCLFLDLLVPEQVFNRRNLPGEKAAVMLWIFGGGYTAGDKSEFNGSGLLERSGNNIIFIAINYRLGAFGWSSGPTFQAGGTANAGLFDQRLAIEWVQEHIESFGGDKNKVTIFGESAGGGSVMHQITAFGGLKGPVPFQRAIPQSPGFLPVTSVVTEENAFDNFLQLLNVSTLEEARQLPSQTVINANALQVAGSTFGEFTYGPTVDGDFVPALPGLLLLHGQFDHSVDILTGHNADEGLLFTPFFINNDTEFAENLHVSLPDISNSTVEFILDTLYPPVFDGSLGFTDEVGRAALLTSELSFTCNDNYMARAFNNRTFAYKFSIPPALHGQDVPYTFFTGQASSATAISATGGLTKAVQNTTVAIVLQEFLTSFAQTGTPTSRTLGSSIPEYGPNANIVNLNLTTIQEQMDDTDNPRCLFWQKALFF